MSTNSEVVKADRGDDRGSAVIEQTEALLNPAAVTRGQTQATVANVIVNPLEAQNQNENQNVGTDQTDRGSQGTESPGTSQMSPPPSYHDIPGTVPAHQGVSRGPPPSYEDAVDPNAEPPSYDSLFGRIRDTHKASRNFIDFLAKLLLLLLGTIGCNCLQCHSCHTNMHDCHWFYSLQRLSSRTVYTTLPYCRRCIFGAQVPDWSHNKNPPRRFLQLVRSASTSPSSITYYLFSLRMVHNRLRLGIPDLYPIIWQPGWPTFLQQNCLCICFLADYHCLHLFGTLYLLYLLL